MVQTIAMSNHDNINPQATKFVAVIFEGDSFGNKYNILSYSNPSNNSFWNC